MTTDRPPTDASPALDTCGCCEGMPVPRPAANAPGLPALSYRTDIQPGFYARMLHSLPGAPASQNAVQAVPDAVGAAAELVGDLVAETASLARVGAELPGLGADRAPVPERGIDGCQ